MAPWRGLRPPKQKGPAAGKSLRGLNILGLKLDILADGNAAPKSNSAAAAEFLKQIAAGGRVAVAAIVPDGPLTGRTFDTSADAEGLREFLESNSSTANLYYSLNEPRPAAEQVGANGRLREEDVSRLRGIVVDLDPQPGAEAAAGGYHQERQRLLGIASTWQDHFFAAPTAAVDSGNGVQLVWLFPEPLPNDEASRARVKGQAKALGALLGSDRVQSVDHLFRIPFTVNLPDRRKIAKGRAATASRLLYCQPKASHTLEALSVIAAPLRADDGTKPPVAIELDYAAVLAAAAGEDLPESLAAKRDALRVPKAADRSARDFALAAQAVELGVTDPTELAQIVFSLSPDKLLETDDQGRGDYYASRTIAQALAKTAPRQSSSPERWFAGTPEAARQASRRELRVVRGLVNPRDIRVREWLIQPRLPIGDVTQCVGEPGISKSTFALRDALIVATGRESILRGEGADRSPINLERLHGDGAVIVYNAEDRLEEMERRLAAAQRHYGLSDGDMKHPIILWSGVDHGSLKVMARRGGDRGPLQRAEGADRLEQAIADHCAVLVVLDPQISLVSGGQENDNDDADALMQELAEIAARRKANITVIHHTSKASRGAAGDMGAGRGGFAAVGKVRSAFTLTNVTGGGAGEASWGATPEEQLIRLDYSKVSHDRKPREPLVFRRLSAPVGNSSGEAPGSASDVLAGGPREQLRARGDYAPVLELVDTNARVKASESKLSEKAFGTAAKVAAVVDAVLGEREAADLSDLWVAVGDGLREAGLSKAGTGRALTSFIVDALASKPAVERDGQAFRIEAVKQGDRRSAPWRIQRVADAAEREAA